jgi:hypothetical protein
MRTKMNRSLLILLAVAAFALGCDDDDHDPVFVYHDSPPVPTGVYTITGDGFVEILWIEVRTADLAAYRVYRSSSELGAYHFIGGSIDNYFIDTDVDNGITYFYAVTSVGQDDYESELSYENAFDTPRPAGRNLTIYDQDENAGVDFSDYDGNMIQDWDDSTTDIYLLWHFDRYCFASRDVDSGGEVFGTDIQHAGYVETLDEISWAPDGGWSTETADTLVIFEDHGYLVWTWDNNYAKFKVVEIGDDYVVIDWAYQTDEGNPELAVVPIIRGEEQAIAKSARPRSGDSPLPGGSAPATRATQR